MPAATALHPSCSGSRAHLPGAWRLPHATVCSHGAARGCESGCSQLHGRLRSSGGGRIGRRARAGGVAPARPRPAPCPLPGPPLALLPRAERLAGMAARVEPAEERWPLGEAACGLQSAACWSEDDAGDAADWISRRVCGLRARRASCEGERQRASPPAGAGPSMGSCASHAQIQLTPL